MTRIALSLLALCLAVRAQAKPVELAPVVEKEVASARSFVASVAPVRRTKVGSEVEGLVAAYAAREGLRVEKNHALAQLSTKLVDVRLAAARAELESRAQELAELENGSRPEEKEQATARVAQAETEVALRRWKLDNAERLLRSGSVTEDEKIEAELALRTAEARLEEEQAARKLVEAGPRKEKIARAAARLLAQQAEVQRLTDDRDRHTIRAPFSGYVVVEHSQVGAWMDKGGAVAELVELDEVDVVVPVLEDFVSGIKLKMKVSVAVDALPAERFDGVVSAIVPMADARARTFPVKIRIKNRKRGGTVLLKAGMFARVTLAIGEKVKALLVPKDAIVLGGPAPMVYVVDEETSTVRPVPVQLGVAHAALIQVLGNIAKGQRVVVKGNERLRPGDKVSAGR